MPMAAHSKHSRIDAACARAWLAGLLLVAVSGVLIGWPLAAPGADVASARDSDLKAAYIYNFAKFTQWPETSFAEAGTPLVIGVVGDPRVVSALQKIAAGRLVNGHKVDVRELTLQQAAAGVHILFVTGLSDERLDLLAQALASPGLLGIGESERFLSAGGIIRFVVDGERLKFEINLTSAQRARITLSSQLLMLAKAVRR
jgi:hypothetical protein